MASSLFYFGEIGFNDYSFALLKNDTVGLAESLVPHIVGLIRSALIDQLDACAEVDDLRGATKLANGNLDVGVEPEYPHGDHDPGHLRRAGPLVAMHLVVEHPEPEVPLPAAEHKLVFCAKVDDLWGAAELANNNLDMGFEPEYPHDDHDPGQPPAR